MKVHCICIYENSIMKPTTNRLKEGGKRRENVNIRMG
jgi:hypothetical protein